MAMQDPQVPLPIRMAAARLLVRLGDPRFEAVERGGTRWIPPPLAPVPAGDYPVGSSPHDVPAAEGERPPHEVKLESFQIGRHPVIVAEYRCFVEAGGYRRTRYWETEDARARLAGADPAGSPTGRLLRLRQRLLDSGRPLEAWAEEHAWKPETLSNWQRWTAVSEDLCSIIPDHPRTEPVWWDASDPTGDNQPVIGVTW